MTNEQAIGKIFADEKVDHTDKSIPRADVAAVLAQSVTEEKTFHKTFEILSGTPTQGDPEQYVRQHEKGALVKLPPGLDCRNIQRKARLPTVFSKKRRCS
ncbi:hypothetical protein CMV16_13975 [Peribacillus simplex]|nr:hypothetical protein CMV16_13975 [Peribacillus simplex]